MKKALLFIILFIAIFVPKSFGIEEILPDFDETESNETLNATVEENTFLERVFGQKSLKFDNEVLNEIEYGVNYKGILKFTHFDNENDLSTTYPFTIEPYLYLYSKDRKNQLKMSILPTINYSKFDNDFMASINDFYFLKKINDNHQILIGKSRTPVGIEGVKSPYKLDLINRSQLASNFGNVKTLGVRFKGDVKMFEYDLGGYSSTRYLQDLGDGLEFAGWLGYKPFYNKETPLKNLKLGAGINYGRRDRNYTVISTGASWDYKKVFMTAEYGYAQNYNGNSGLHLGKAQGANGTIGYNLTDKLQLVSRYDLFNSNLDNSKYKTQYSAGVNYFVFGDRVKFALNYIFEQQKHNNKNMVLFLTQFMI